MEEPYDTASRLYGASLDPRTHRELAQSLQDWRALPAADRTFVLAHLTLLQLEGLDRLSRSVDDLCDTLERAPSPQPMSPDDEVTEEVERSASASSAASEMQAA